VHLARGDGDPVSVLLVPTTTLSEAWTAALNAAVAAPGGQLVHLLMTVLEPCAELPAVRQAVDDVLASSGNSNIETVAGTIFPVDLYPVPPFGWHPDLHQGDQALVDAAATTLYDSYARMLPLLLTANGNKSGTYFQRMISYPGPGAGGFNQLQSRIDGLRSMSRRAGQGNHFNLDLGGDGVHAVPDGDSDGAGVQLLRPEQLKERGFPCLVHVDLTVTRRTLHLFAVYRRQNLITKAYGNLLGLSRLQAFLCQQTGLAVGQLGVMATFADAEYAELTKGRAKSLAETAQAVVDGAVGGAA
jgi:hypothetical protein